MGLFSSLFGRNKDESPSGPEGAAIQAAIEQLVEDVDPRMRFIRGYRKKLRPGVEVALKHARDIVARIPGPFALDTETWRTEPSKIGVYNDNTQTGNPLFAAYRLIQ